MSVQTLSPAMLEYSKVVFHESHTGSNAGESAVQALKDLDFSGFLHYLDSPESNAMASASSDLSHPLSDYFVSTSHNTYLSGNQLYGKSSATAYANVSFTYISTI